MCITEEFAPIDSDDLIVKRLTKGSLTMATMFEALKNIDGNDI